MSTNLEFTKLPLASFVLAKVKPQDKGRPEPGRVTGTATVKVAFDLKIGAPYMAKVSQAIPWQRIAALALAKLNGTHLEHTLRLALDSEIDVDEHVERISAVLDTLRDSTERLCNGKVTGSTSIVEATFENLDYTPAEEEVLKV